MDNTGVILTLAYPDTVVMLSNEWYSPFLRFIGIGKKNYLRAGHAALVLINKNTGVLEYHDFGRYISPAPNGRVRGSETDNELHFPIKAIIKNNAITNLEAILSFLATHPKLTHGEGKLVASVCKAVNYKKAKQYIADMQNRCFIPYLAFGKNAYNCAHFVTDTLITSVTNAKIKKALIHSKWFTPSTVGNVLFADTENNPYEVLATGEVFKFKGSQKSENLRCFLDRLKDHNANLVGTLKEKPVAGLDKKAQWLSGIGSGAWFELHDLGSKIEYRFRRISAYGTVDCDAVFKINKTTFNYNSDFEFLHNSNCKFLNIKQGNAVFSFKRLS